MTAALDGLGVLVTRPAHQAGSFARRVEDLGGTALRFPVLAIESLLDTDAARRALESACGASLLVFTSRNAVDIVAPRLQGRRAPGAGTVVAAVGSATARALRAHGLPVHVAPPAPANSESLLRALGGRLVPGGQALLLRGEGGRELLGRALEAAGLRVSDVPCYRRIPGPADGERLRAWLRAGEMDVATVTSVEIAQRLVQLAGEPASRELLAIPLLAGSERIAAACRDLGWQSPMVAPEPTDDAMIAALARWRT